MIQDYLKKLQQLQLETINSGIIIDIKTLYDREENYPWLVISVFTDAAGTDLDKDNYLSVHMYGDMYKDDAENERHQAEVYAKVETFVKGHLSKKVDKDRFMKAYERALKLQKDCLFTKVSVEVKTLFCKGNYKESNLHAWTVGVTVFIEKEDGRALRSTDWSPWYDDKRFYKDMEAIEAEIAQIKK